MNVQGQQTLQNILKRKLWFLKLLMIIGICLDFFFRCDHQIGCLILKHTDSSRNEEGNYSNIDPQKVCHTCLFSIFRLCVIWNYEFSYPRFKGCQRCPFVLCDFNHRNCELLAYQIHLSILHFGVISFINSPKYIGSLFLYTIEILL